MTNRRLSICCTCIIFRKRMSGSIKVNNVRIQFRTTDLENRTRSSNHCFENETGSSSRRHIGVTTSNSVNYYILYTLSKHERNLAGTFNIMKIIVAYSCGILRKNCLKEKVSFEIDPIFFEITKSVDVHVLMFVCTRTVHSSTLCTLDGGDFLHYFDMFQDFIDVKRNDCLAS